MLNKNKMAIYMAERRKERRSSAIKYLGGKCVSCGATVDLHFDHKNPKEKYLNISSPKLLDGNIQLFWNEVFKCQLLCSECHKYKSKENKEYGGGQNKLLFRGCGTGPSYNNGCRCKLCKKWKSDYRKKVVRFSGEQATN